MPAVSTHGLSTSDALRALIQKGWAQHYRDPSCLLSVGEQIVALAAAQSPGSAAEGWGWLHQAWGHRFLSRAPQSEQALAKAQALFDALGHEGGQAACRDLAAMALSAHRRWQESLALLDRNRAVPTLQRGAYERLQTHQRRGQMLDQLGDRDAALRERYLMLAAARESGDDAPVALALGLLGGQLADLYNLEEADRLCAKGVQLAERCGAFQAWSLAALNRLNALVALGRGAEGLALVQALQAAEPRMNQRALEQRSIVYADVWMQSGQPGQALALLQRSVEQRHAGSESLLSWTVVQVACLLALGEPAQARHHGEAWLANPQVGTDPGQLPAEMLRLLLSLSQACEQTADLAAALHHQRRAFEVHDTLVGRSARARRLVLEIEHGLDRERSQREQAQQRELAAEAERQRLDVLNQALEAANLAKSRFLAAASHDLRQPVQALAMTMATLEHEPVTPAQAELVQRLTRSLHALMQMFDVLLDISRLDAGVVSVARQPVALRSLLQRLADEQVARAMARGLTLRLRLPPDSAAACSHSDPVLLERMLRNLLDNAIKYTPEGEVLLALRRRAGHWLIQVMDTGIGMPPEVLARVFEEFYQADNPERDRVHGLGLGMAIVQRLAQLLGHSIALRSRPGHGTVATLQLAAMVPPQAEAEADAPRLPAASSPSALWVAVVDDDAEVRESLAALLVRWGHQVIHGANEPELVQAWQARGSPRVQALLCDMRLRAHLTGLDVTAALRARWQRSVPALIITGDVAPERLQSLRDSGLPWLPKPVMPMRLRSWLEGQAAGD